MFQLCLDDRCLGVQRDLKRIVVAGRRLLKKIILFGLPAKVPELEFSVICAAVGLDLHLGTSLTIYCHRLIDLKLMKIFLQILLFICSNVARCPE